MERGRDRLTRTPNKVLNTNNDMKFQANLRAMSAFISDKLKFVIALKRTTDVASLTTPSPNTRLYKSGVSS